MGSQKAARMGAAVRVLIALVALGCSSHPAMPWRHANAHPCTAEQVRASADGSDSATGHHLSYYKFRNVGAKPCILRGFPLVIASEPGKPDVTASHTSWFIYREQSGSMPPGGVTVLSLETVRDCPARYATPGTFPGLIYHTVTVGIPGGGSVLIKGKFDVLCGLFTGPFRSQ